MSENDREADEDRSDPTDEPDPEASAPDASSADASDAEATDGDDGSAGSEPIENEDSGGFLGNIKNARDQLGDAKEAFSNARGAGSLPTDEEGRVRLVCRRYEERRLAPLDDKGRPTCYEAGNADCESCVEAVSDGSVGTW